MIFCRDALEGALKALREWHNFKHGYLYTRRRAHKVNIYFCTINFHADRPMPRLYFNEDCLVALFYVLHTRTGYILYPCRERWLLPSRHWNVRCLALPFPPTIRPYIPECLKNHPLQHPTIIGFPS